MGRIIFHIDVNSAYLSWSAIHKLAEGSEVDLRTIPSIIGGDEKSRHGIVLAKSIPAKKYGIRTAEPVASAFRKCPTLVMEPPDHAMYQEYSKKLMEVLSSFSPDLEQVSIDECYLDFTPIAHLYASPVAAAELIKNTVYEKLHFTVNVGISSVKVLAKMASDFEKPNRVHTLFPEEIREKMWPLPISELYMVGGASAKRLAQYGILTIGELACTDPEFLTAHFKSHGRLMWEYANGIDDSPVQTEKQELKGVGNSVTLSEDVDTPEDAKKVLLMLAEKVSGRLRSYGQLAGSVTVEIKYHNFVRMSHQMQLFSPTSTTRVLYEAACQLFDEFWNGMPVRLLGIRTTKLISSAEPVQLSIFDLDFTEKASEETKKEAKKTAVSSEKLKKLDTAMDAIKKRYGEHAIQRGSSMLEKKSKN